MSKTAFAALTPYVEIYLSALLIDELTTTRLPERLTSLVLWIIGSAAVITLVQAILNRLHAVESSEMWEHIHHLFGKKMLSMDFVVIDSPSTHTLVSKIQQNTNGGGWGLDRIVWQLDNVWSSILKLFGGSALIVTLFTSKVESGSEVEFLNSPFVTAGVITLMVAITFASPLLSAVGGSIYAPASGRQMLTNRLFGYYGWFGIREETSVDS